MTMKNDTKIQEELTCRFKITWGISWILTRALEILKKLHFSGLLVTKVYNVWTKTVQWSYLSWHCEELCKIWRKTDLQFGKWHEKFGKFSLEHLKVPKLGLWWDPFVQSRKFMSLKFTEELCLVIMKNDRKTEE